MMIKRFRKEAVLILTGLFCLALFRPAFSQDVVVSQAMTVEQLTADISQKWNNIQDFQSDLTVGVQVSGKMTKIKGAMWQKGRVFRTKMTMPPEIMERYGMVGSGEVLAVFDGKTMWFSLPTMMNMVMKADISALGGKPNNVPFSKPLYSLPAVSYQLRERKRNGNDYYFLETSEIKDFFQKSAVSFISMLLPTKPPLRSIGVWVNKNTLFPDLIEFYAQKNVPVMYMEFKNVKTDQGLSSKIFVSLAPEGVKPQDIPDITEILKAMAGKMTQSATAPDTAQAATVSDTAQVPQ